MSANAKERRETWNTHSGMIMAMMGTAIGLGNIWRFPYLCGRHGGGIFLIPYVTLLFCVAIFTVMCEWVIGRFTRRDPLGAYSRVGIRGGEQIGAWGIIGPFFLYSYYAVVTAWVLFYIGASLFSLYFGRETELFFRNFLSSPWLFVCHAAVVAITSTILAFGVQKGIEKTCKIIMPLLFVLMVILSIRSITLPGAHVGVEFYMRPRWESLWNVRAWADALGQVFFTLSVGMGAMIMYGSYLKDRWGIPQNALVITLGNSSASILAGFIIFPAAFALGQGELASGSEAIGLSFIVIPEIFERMPLGVLFGTLFFVLLFFAAISSAISIQEPGVAYVIEDKGWSRKRGAVVSGIVLWLLGLPFVINGFVDGGVADALALLGKMDQVIGSLALPIFGFVSVVTVGWVMKEKGFRELNKNTEYKLGRWVRPWIRYVVPFGVSLLIFCSILQITGVFDKVLPPEASAGEFVSLGITPETIVMMFFVTLIFWGGFVSVLLNAISVERKKEGGL